MSRLFLLVIILLAANGVLARKWIGEAKKVDGVDYQFKCYSDNPCWPSSRDWAKLNKTVE